MSLKWKSPAESATVTYATVSGSGAARITAPASAPSTTRSTAWHLVDHFVELDDSVALEAGEHCPGLGNEPHHLGRRLVGRPARRWALVGARAQPGDYEQPSDLSLSASACRWSRHARSFSRSLATTSAGARATKFWLVSFAASPVS